MRKINYLTSVLAVIVLFSTNVFAEGSANGNLSGNKENKNAVDYYDVYSTDYAKEIVYFLTQEKLMGRKVGTPQSKRAARFILDEFKSIGYDVELQKTDKEGLTEILGEARSGNEWPGSLTNVIARVNGKDPSKLVVIGAHFDAKGLDENGRIRVGADDNASGIAVLLSLAKMLKAADVVPEYTVLFCAWDGEEEGIGMIGSRYYVGNWYKERETQGDHAKDSIVLYMNFDMMGRTKTPENPAVTFAWNNNYPYLLDICKEAQKDVPMPFQILLDERTGDGKGGSDYMPFSAHNIPFIAWMEDDMHADYHKYTDTPEKLDWEKVRKSTLLAFSVLWRII